MVGLVWRSVADQAALHGLLNKLRDLGLPLLSVQRLNDMKPQESGGSLV
jgi:hypothetical protein